MKQVTLFGETKQALEGYSEKRKKIIREHLEKVEKHNELVKKPCEKCGRNADIKCKGHFFCMTHYEEYYYQNDVEDFDFI